MIALDNELNDSLDDLLGGPVVGQRPALPAHYQAPTPETYFEKCAKCNGTGQTRWGVCYRCQGQKGNRSKRPGALPAVAP